ncbi:ribulokinase [Neolewinella lacunae]|uniref:Ribulokinase n=1 Tax=Neolewinella lacunae TaxID=1517758 RepID=A0A923PJ86_9BACT|nr:ribulokinase [Neolewinella lacunae]MBC6995087.1 ribulokinase [Neolewinella lacunae]MDN3634037.1 ribulokinase [Neolewinella lacunae]
MEETPEKAAYTLGIDFGTDSVRALIVAVADGAELAVGVSYYPRWQREEYCLPAENQFRQHPLDYTESMVAAVREALAAAPASVAGQIMGIAVDTTGSTPVAVDASGTPLALLPAFAENPNAMFVLWKDHTAIQEAEEINALCRKWPTDYTQYEGGIYSSEWFWAKLLHVTRADAGVAAAAHSWVEHCDWIPFLLSGGKDVGSMKRSRCAAGHKALWHPDWGGLPPEEFLVALDPLLAGLRDRLFEATYTSDEVAGHLSAEWAEKLSLAAGIPIVVGAFDAHMGAVGGQIEPFHLSKVMGTSTCDMLVVPADHVGARTQVQGICGQVDGSVIPGMMGMEAGQSAFGDVYAWFARLISWPLENILAKDESLTPELREQLIQNVRAAVIPELSKAAAALPPGGEVIAIDWFNGRRTPDADQRLKGAIAGLNLGADAPRVFRALVEATCYGARAIVERFVAEGIPVAGIIGLGGVAKKSPFIMQTMANVLNRPIRIATSEQTCALGAAMFAAVGAGLYPDIPAAVAAMAGGFDAEYHPQADRVAGYDQGYARYRQLGEAAEQLAH